MTPRILRELAEADVRATFFLLVDQVRLAPEIAKEIVQGGHEIGLHGIDHRPVRGMRFGDVTEYLNRGKSELEVLADTPVHLYRPTFGAQSLATFVAARRLGLEPVVWTNDVADWDERTVAEVVADARRTPPGGILLFHDRLDGWGARRAPQNSLDRPKVVAEIVQTWADHGFTASTVGELVDSDAVRRSVWFRP